jgi:hypothetical protein
MPKLHWRQLAGCHDARLALICVYPRWTQTNVYKGNFQSISWVWWCLYYTFVKTHKTIDLQLVSLTAHKLDLKNTDQKAIPVKESIKHFWYFSSPVLQALPSAKSTKTLYKLYILKRKNSLLSQSKGKFPLIHRKSGHFNQSTRAWDRSSHHV